MDLIPITIHCPYCAERLHLSLDPSEYTEYEPIIYIEDCQVCCQPITIQAHMDENGIWQTTGSTLNETP